MTAITRVFSILAISGLSSCSFDFTDVERDTPATLMVTLVANDKADSLSLNASIHPGRDATGKSRSVTSDLAVFGQPITSVRTGPSNIRTYQAQWRLSARFADTTSLSFIAPDIEDLPGGPHTFKVSPPRRIGSDTLSVTAGEAVVLPIVRSDLPNGATTFWRLELFDSVGTRRVSILTQGEMPEQFMIPRSWFPSTAPATYGVLLDTNQRFSTNFVHDNYKFTILLHSQLNWTVKLQP